MADELNDTDAVKTTPEGDGVATPDGAKTEKVDFTPEQQAKVQSLIDSGYAKAYEKAKGEFGDSNALKAEVARLNADLKEAKSSSKKAPDVDTSAMQEALKEKEGQLAEMKTMQTNMLRMQKNNKVLATIVNHDVFNPQDVLDLISSSIGMDDEGNPVIQGDNGSPKVNAEGNPMSLDEYVSDWLKSRPNYLKASANSGAGSGGSKFGEGGDRINLNTLEAVRNTSTEDINKLIAGGGISIPSSVEGQTFTFKPTTNPWTNKRKAAVASGQR